MKRKAPAMSTPDKHNIPHCSVVVRRLTLGEISRMIISPFFISNRCGRCKKLAYYGPKCTTCSISYHYGCALSRKTCCDLPIFLHENNSFELCPKCKDLVQFGPSCLVCNAKFHSYCLSPYDRCCQLNLCELPPQRICGKCETVLMFGPSCPICKNIYHLECVGKEINCCGFRIVCDDDSYRYKCKKCQKGTGLGSRMCQLCGAIYHSCCIASVKNCCGKPVPLEIFFISSFQYVVRYFTAIAKKRANLKRSELKVTTTPYSLRSKINDDSKQMRARKKSTGSQTNALDSIAIISVKTELEEKEMDIPSSPPVLEREMSRTPEPSSSNAHKPDSNIDGDETLKNLFDFLYNMVKKFPPQLQTQVKIDLFKTVTEAEMKLRCNMVDDVQHNVK